MSYRMDTGKTGKGKSFISKMKDSIDISGLHFQKWLQVGVCSLMLLFLMPPLMSAQTAGLHTAESKFISRFPSPGAVSGNTQSAGLEASDYRNLSGYPRYATWSAQLSEHPLTDLSLITTYPASPARSVRSPEPGGAFLRSLAVPGWGHYYAERDQWNRGKVHLAADILLIAGLTGSLFQEKNLRATVHTQAALRAGVDTKNRSRAFQLAIGGYDNLGEYNDYQLRSRNWSRLYPDEQENRWEWKSDEDRRRYNELRSRREHAKNRIPMLLGAMTVNRIISAVSSYNRARNQRITPELSISPVFDSLDERGGYMGTLSITW